MRPDQPISIATCGTKVPAPLIRAVQRCNPALAGVNWVPLQGGRSNHLWQVGDWVVKLYDPAAASPLFPNDSAAEARALRLFAPFGFAPHLRAKGAGWLAYDHVPGRAWIGSPALVAQTLFRLHQLPANNARFRALPSGSNALIAQGAAVVVACQGTLPPPPPLASVAPVRRPCLIHGDAVPGNIIMGPAGLTLIDWQCPALGDATEDLAAFLSPAMQWLYRGAILDISEVEAFLAAYPDSQTVSRYRALAPVYHWRMAAHCLWKAERGATDYATALQLELSALSERHLSP